MKFFGLLVFLVFFIGGVFAILWFFSKLVGVNMFTAMSWGFKEKRFELTLTFFMFYFKYPTLIYEYTSLINNI